eukprot:TRINITY_DN24290_c0_g1_i1.p1 TRINITY_DN24290_c0_g1~~TRINITY_DN24290_c0_g1_i1.p1  ORF type:complete len:357 (-),score=94.58 TRINITY_DN24290_c0_g1_i1:59-1129(-)
MPDNPDNADSEESGIVLAVPAVVREVSSTVKSAVQPAGTFLEGQEYENLVTNNQYYEQVQFSGSQLQAERGRVENLQKEEEEEEGLYSIPQVMSLNNSTTGLTRDLGKDVPVDVYGMGRRFPSMRNTLKKEKKRKDVEERQRKGDNLAGTLTRRLEEMYAKPKKISLKKEKNPSLVIHTKKTQTLAKLAQQRCKSPDEENSYMSVHIKTKKIDKLKCPCSKAQVTKYLVMAIMVVGLIAFLSVGLYLMSGNVVTIDRRNKNSFQGSVPATRSNTWKDFDQINWGTARTWPESSTARSSTSWTSWTKWSRCSSRPCVKGQTMARSRKCVDKDSQDTDIKICIKQGGINVEIEPCFCF